MMNIFKKVVMAGSIFLVAACGNTGVVQMEENLYMVSVKSAKLGFVNAAEEEAKAYKQANDFCKKHKKNVKTTDLSVRNSGVMRSASATLRFQCVD